VPLELVLSQLHLLLIELLEVLLGSLHHLGEATAALIALGMAAQITLKIAARITAQIALKIAAQIVLKIAALVTLGVNVLWHLLLWYRQVIDSGNHITDLVCWDRAGRVMVSVWVFQAQVLNGRIMLDDIHVIFDQAEMRISHFLFDGRVRGEVSGTVIVLLGGGGASGMVVYRVDHVCVSLLAGIRVLKNTRLLMPQKLETDLGVMVIQTLVAVTTEVCSGGFFEQRGPGGLTLGTLNFVRHAPIQLGVEKFGLPGLGGFLG